MNLLHWLNAMNGISQLHLRKKYQVQDEIRNVQNYCEWWNMLRLIMLTKY